MPHHGRLEQPNERRLQDSTQTRNSTLANRLGLVFCACGDLWGLNGPDLVTLDALCHLCPQSTQLGTASAMAISRCHDHPTLTALTQTVYCNFRQFPAPHLTVKPSSALKVSPSYLATLVDSRSSLCLGHRMKLCRQNVKRALLSCFQESLLKPVGDSETPAITPPKVKQLGMWQLLALMPLADFSRLQS